MKANEFEYIFLNCRSCGKKIKIAKNVGSNWRAYDNAELERFMLDHGECENFCGDTIVSEFQK